MPDPVGVAVIGLDHWYSAFHVLDQVVRERAMRLIGIGERNPERLEEARQKYAPQMAAGDPMRLLDDPQVELVFSFVNTADNPDICLEALGRGKPTLCVKPAALTVREANRLAAAADDAGVFWSSFEVSHRLTARSQRLKELLKEGVIGEPISFYQVAQGGLPQPWPGQSGPSWWLEPDRVPGGAWIDHAIYAVDQVRWALEREVESVSATLGNRRHQELGVEDWGIAWLRLTSGFTAVMEDAWTADSGTNFNRYIGTEGSLAPEGDAFVVSRQGDTERIPVPEEERSPFAWIAAATRGQSRLPFTNACSVFNLDTCLAAYESFRTGKHVTPGTDLTRRGR